MALYPPAGAADAQIMKNITMIRGMGDKAYVRDVLESRRDFLRLRARHEKEIAGAYNRAAENVAKRARDVAHRGKLTTRNLAEIEKNLRAEAQRITEVQRSLMRDGYRQSFESAGRPSGNALIRGIESAGASDKLKIAKIQNGFGQINTAAVEAFWSRTRDGMRVSDKIWQINQQNVQTAMRDVLETGIASGRDAVQVSKDLERYVKRGKRTLAKDYPNMMRRMGKRLPKRLNYEALRLVRTEYTRAFQEGVVSRGAVNPAYEGVRWMLSSGHPEPDVCTDYSEVDLYNMGPGVYKKGYEPVTPHPNCLCHLIPVLKDQQEFVDDLDKWLDDPASVPYMEGWYENVYQNQFGGAVVGAASQAMPEATSIKDAERIAKENLNATKVDFSKTDLDSANIMTSELSQLKEKYGLDGIDYIVPLEDGIRLTGGKVTDARTKNALFEAVSGKDPLTGSRFIGLGYSENHVKNVASWDKALKAISQNKLMTSITKTSTIKHEFGHMVSYAKSGTEPFGGKTRRVHQHVKLKQFVEKKRDKNISMRRFKDGVAAQTGDYINTNPAEFFAESFRLFEEGNLPAELSFIKPFMEGLRK